MTLLGALAIATVRISAPFGELEVEETPFPARDFSITSFGAEPGGVKCTEAFAKAMVACESSGDIRFECGTMLKTDLLPYGVSWIEQ